MRPRNEPEIFERSKWDFGLSGRLPLPYLPSYRSHADYLCGFPARKFGGFPCRLCFVFNHAAIASFFSTQSFSSFIKAATSEPSK